MLMKKEMKKENNISYAHNLLRKQTQRQYTKILPVAVSKQ